MCIACLVCLATGVAVAGGDGRVLRVAFVPPVDRAEVMAMTEALARQMGFEVRELGAEQLVDPSLFNPEHFPAAVYTGYERYAYQVKEPGDGVRALLEYVAAGGTLIVSGGCWPFYRPARWDGEKWVRYEGPMPRYQGPKDAWLAQAMARLKQSPTGTFNRFLGLNIAGEATEQFEQPEEEIEFVVTPQGKRLFPSLPGRFPFPASGDLRYRPASARNLGAGVRFISVAEAVGKSGKNYGAGICVVEHVSGRLAGGQVIYMWGTLVSGTMGSGLLSDALLLAAKHARIGGEGSAQVARRASAILGRLAALEKKLEDCRTYPERSYFACVLGELRSRVELARRVAAFGNVERAREMVKRVEEERGALQRRVAAVAGLAAGR